MRVADRPSYQMDWTEFAGQDRTKLQMDKHAREEVSLQLIFSPALGLIVLWPLFAVESLHSAL